MHVAPVRNETIVGGVPSTDVALLTEKRAAAVTFDNDDGSSFRIYDDSSKFFEIKDNPITKVGVFPYSGAQISSNLDPDKIYNVYRSAEELSNPETIKSFEVLPLIDEHAMLGAKDDGLTPAEKKGIHGVVGNHVRFDSNSGYLLGNIKIFSDSLSKKIDVDGKKELSAGYYCDFIDEPGVYDGQSYDFVQKNMRGNHIALVNEGRSGPDVAVRDHLKFSFDSKELKMADKDMEKEKEDKAEDAEESSKELNEKAEDEAGEYKKFVNKADVEDEDEKKDKAEDEDEEKKKGDSDKSAGMDAMEKTFMVRNAQKQALVEKLSSHIGTFDAADKTLNEVVKYGMDKLRLKCEPGHEKAMLEGFLMGAKLRPVATPTFAGDSQVDSGCVDNFIQGCK